MTKKQSTNYALKRSIEKQQGMLSKILVSMSSVYGKKKKIQFFKRAFRQILNQFNL